jgi:Heparan-alpha-glucosaminide N-acetyltransferase, catalytic
MGGRIVGIDIARCLALLGMMATHILPGVVDGEVPLAQQVAGGRASALFAVLAGVSLTLVAGSRRPLRGRPWLAMLAGTVVRSLVIGLVGLLLGGLETGIAIILVYYAVLFVVAVPFMALPTRALAVVAVAWVVLAPLLSQWLRDRVALTSYDVPSFDSFEAFGVLARDLLLTGYYPVLTWVPYLLLGLLVGRLDLTSNRTAGALAAGGAAAALLAWQVSDALTSDPDVRAALIRSFEGAGWRGDLASTLTRGLYGVTPTDSSWWLAVRAPHTATTFDLLMTGGCACLVLAGCLVLGRLAPRLLAVVFGAGAMTFTLYTVHVVLRSEGLWDGDDLATFLGQAALVLAIGAAYRLAGRRGPLEFFTGELSAGTRKAVAGRR